MNNCITTVNGLVALCRALFTKPAFQFNSTRKPPNLVKLFCLISGAIGLLLLPSLVSAQVKPKKVLGTFVYKDNAYNYEFNKTDIDNYSFNISKLDVVKKTDSVVADADSADVETAEPATETTKPSNNTTPGILFDEFSKDVFITAFRKQMVAKYSVADTGDTLKQKGAELFYNILKKLEFLDDEPITAHLILKNDKIYSFLISNSSAYYNDWLSGIIVRHNIKNVDVETEDGAIKNIIVRLVDPRNNDKTKLTSRGSLEFKNSYPISISGKHDPERLSKVKLYCFDCNGIVGLNRYIKLSDLIELDITLENDKDDYSPANTTFTLVPQQPIVELRKEKRSKIIDIAAFSDFVGLDQEQPNGLIQIEAKRKINITTKYAPFRKRDDQDIASQYDLDKYRFKRLESTLKPDSTPYQVILKDSTYIDGVKVHSRIVHNKESLKNYKEKHNGPWVITPIIDTTIYIENRQYKSGYYVIFPSIEPRLLFSKLDGNNKFLLLDSTQSADKRTEPLKQFQYQLASFGFTMNVLKFFYPQKKLSWNVIDVGGYWYRTRIQSIKDTATDKSVAINSGYISIATILSFKPDSRWGANSGFTYIKQKAFNNDYKFDKNKGLFQANFDAYIKTNEDAKLFFRFRWIFDEHDPNKNFTQIQLGYSLNIFASK